MKSNENLQKDILDAIKWEPLLHAAEIGVIAIDGIITLTGTVDSYAKKAEAEDATKKVTGVKAVVEKIEVQFGSMGKKTDGEIAGEIVNAFKYNWKIPYNEVKIKVEDGWVTLEGELQWNYQKEAAKKSASNLFGVKGLTNGIIIKSDLHDTIEKEDIQRALERNWSIDNQEILVIVYGNKVTLNGTVASLYQKEEAGRIAWKTPGVWDVNNELIIENSNNKKSLKAPC